MYTSFLIGTDYIMNTKQAAELKKNNILKN